MPDGHYYRKQAQLFARLALATNDVRIAAHYNELALEQLAKAEQVEPTSTPIDPFGVGGDEISRRRF